MEFSIVEFIKSTIEIKIVLKEYKRKNWPTFFNDEFYFYTHFERHMLHNRCIYHLFLFTKNVFLHDVGCSARIN
jgi:hypothetical protein